MIKAASSARGDTYLWNSTGADWGGNSSWRGGIPGSGDTALFDPQGNTVSGAVVNPIISSPSQAIASLVLAPNQQLGGWTISSSGSGALSISSSLTTYGPATYTLNNLSFSTAPPTVNVNSGSTLVATGISAIAIGQVNLNINSGTLSLDYTNSLTGSAGTTSATVSLSGGGTLGVIGNPNGIGISLGMLNSSASNLAVGGVNTIQVNPNGANTPVNFANSGNFATSPGTAAVYVFQATNGALGDPLGAQVTFTGTPFLGANGLLSSAAGSGNVGFAIVNDSNGVNFATWNSTFGVVAATPTITGTTAANLQAGTANDVVQFNPSSNQSATGTITNGSLRITPQATGLSLTLSGNSLTTNALMLDGPNSFSILNGTGTSAFGGAGPRYIYVNNASTTLSTDLALANGGFNTIFAGPGFVSFTDSASQNTLSGANRFVIAGGVVRGNNTEIGFGSSGKGIISLTGGVLEITGGKNGTGTSADFTRALTASTPNSGTVTWGGGQTTNEIGSGGFSAYGATASVNIGGAATAASLQWNSLNFVGDGYALKFGSTQSNAVLNFLNGIQLDNGSSYELREINVTAGVGGDKTVIVGKITGASNADLVKTGTGILEFGNSSNSYSGNTYISGGTLRVGADGELGSAVNQLIIANGSTLNTSGTFTFSSNRALELGAGGGIVNTDSGTTLTYGGVVAGLSLTKAGTGTLVLSSANTYTGNTTISAGTLVVTNTVGSGTGTGSVTVASGGKLTGTGIIAGATTIAANGTLAPGGVTNPGVLTISNSVTFTDSTSSFNVRAKSSTVGNGSSNTGYDQLAVTSGTVNLNNATLNLTVGYTPNPNVDHLLIVNNTDSAVTLAGTFNGLPNNGSIFSAGGVNWQIYYGTAANAYGGSGGNDVVIVPVPEPGFILTGSLCILGAGYAIRRKRRPSGRSGIGVSLS